MAKAIKHIEKYIPTPQEEQTQGLQEILKSLADNKEAVLATIDLIKYLQEMGILDTLRGLFEKRGDVAAIALQQVNQPAMHNTIKTAMSAFKFLGSIKTSQIQPFMDGIKMGLDRASEQMAKGSDPSLWELGKSVRDPEIRSTLGIMMEFLHGLGEGISPNNQREIH